MLINNRTQGHAPKLLIFNELSFIGSTWINEEK